MCALSAHIPPAGHHQRGAILVFCLVFLTLLTMTATVSMEAAMVEQRAAGRMQDYQVALQAAEAALVVAEEWLASQTERPQTGAAGETVVWRDDALDPETTDAVPWWQDAARQQSWWRDNAQVAVAMQGLSAPPRYIIEELMVFDEEVPHGTEETEQRDWLRVVYRITARGSGRAESSSVTLQLAWVAYYQREAEEAE